MNLRHWVCFLILATQLSACARYVDIPKNDYSTLDRRDAKHSFRVIELDGSGYTAKDVALTDSSLTLTGISRCFDPDGEPCELPKGSVSIPIHDVARVQEIGQHKKTSLLVLAGVLTAIVAGLRWVASNSGGGR